MENAAVGTTPIPETEIETEVTPEIEAQAATVDDDDFAEKNWAVFVDSEDEVTFIGAVKGKGKLRAFISDLIESNPELPRTAIIPRQLGKPQTFQTKELITF